MKQKFLSKKLRSILLLASLILLIIIGIFFYFVKLIPQYDQFGLPTSAVSYKFISSRPEAHLYYPSSQIFSPFGQPQRNTIEGTDVAFAGAIMTSNADSNSIYKWYQSWLLQHGWKKDDNAILGLVNTQLSLQSYSRNNREVFYVAMDDPKLLAGTLGKDVPYNITVFEFRYIIKPNK